MKYNTDIVTKYLVESGVPEPIYEHMFHPSRKWRFDLAWPKYLLYLEVDGGIWVKGGHNRGAQMLKDWEKRNAASVLGWRGLWCQPKDLCTKQTVESIIGAIGNKIIFDNQAQMKAVIDIKDNE